METTNFYHLIILDASGSMGIIRQQALNGCNETLQSIRLMDAKDDNNKHFATLISFNSEEPTRYIYDCTVADQTKDLSNSDYRPVACTPLYDAIGLGITHLQGKIDKNNPHEVLVTIITDGEENSSTIFNAKKVKSIIEELKHDHWTFAFIGANINERAEAEQIGIHNTMAFEQSEEGTSDMFTKLNNARVRYCCAATTMSDEERDSNFFDI